MTTDYNNESVVAGTMQPLPQVVASYREDIDQSVSWDVQPSAGDFNVGVDFASGILSVPLTGDDYSRLVQLRELVRLRVSPTNNDVYKQAADNWATSDVTEHLLKIAEQARVAAITRQFAGSMGISIEPDGSEKVLGKRLATANSNMSWDRCVEYAVQHFGTKSFDQFASGVRSVNSDWSKRLTKLNKQLINQFDGSADILGDTTKSNYGGDVFGPRGFNHTVYAAAEIASYMSSGYKSPDDVKLKLKEKQDDRARNYGNPTIEEIMNGTVDTSSTTLDVGDMPDDFEFEFESNDNDDDYFGKLIFSEDKPLTVEVAGYMRRKRRARPMGRALSYPGRMLTDPERRVFGTKTKVKGGIVVIDISGSMRLSQQDIEDIVEAAPAALIMAYSDPDNGAGSPNAYILANRGWRVRNIGYIDRCNNGVDGSALTWALRHRKFGEDVIWVSDGEVFGMKGSRGTRQQLVLDCAKLIKKHRIIMIPSVRDAVTAFKSGKPMRQFNKPAGPIRDALLGQRIY